MKTFNEFSASARATEKVHLKERFILMSCVTMFTILCAVVFSVDDSREVCRFFEHEFKHFQSLRIFSSKVLEGLSYTYVIKLT